MTDFHTIEAKGIRVTLDLRAGHVRELVIERDARRITPVHTAPWVDDRSILDDEAIAPNLKYLSGDFFCAPFGTADIDPTWQHGWTANSRWQHVETIALPDGVSARYRLERRVMGATVEKTFTLHDGHSFLYEAHAFIGGGGAIPVANHAMTRFPAGGRLSFSKKSRALTPDGAPEPDPKIGRSRLAYPASSIDPQHLPLADGGVADITRYPFAERHEDFVTLVEDKANRFGWLAGLRPDSRDMFLTLKNPADYPVTFLWFSNGGRDYAPWNSRHIGVLGMEEGRAYMGNGHKASIAPNPLSESAVPTALELVPDGRAEVRNVIGGLPVTNGDDPAAEIVPENGVLKLRLESGASIEVPFDTDFLGR